MATGYVYVLTQTDKEGRQTCHGFFSSLCELDRFLVKNLSQKGTYHVYKPPLNKGLKSPMDTRDLIARCPEKIYGLHRVLDVRASRKGKREVTRVRRLRELYWPGQKPKLC